MSSKVREAETLGANDANCKNKQPSAKVDVKSLKVNKSDENKIKFGINSFDVWALGITIVIGGQYFSWNTGLVAGVGTYGIAVLLIGAGYIVLILNIAETSSGLPFTGGSYGLARCALGNYWGFLLGCSETVEYIFYVSVAVLFLENMLQLVLPNIVHYPPVTWLIIYIVAVFIHVFGGRHFWTFNRLLAIVSMLILLLYCFGSMKYVNFK